MITEQGTIKTGTPINGDVQKEITAQGFKLGIINTILGGLFLVGYIVVKAVWGSAPGELVFTMLLFLGVVMLFSGLFLIINRRYLVAQSMRMNRVGETEFFSSYFIFREFVDGELVAMLKVYYGRITRLRETQSYIFIFNTGATAVPVPKAQLSSEELSNVRTMIASRAMPVKE